MKLCLKEVFLLCCAAISMVGGTISGMECKEAQDKSQVRPQEIVAPANKEVKANRPVTVIAVKGTKIILLPARPARHIKSENQEASILPGAVPTMDEEKTDKKVVKQPRMFKYLYDQDHGGKTQQSDSLPPHMNVRDWVDDISSWPEVSVPSLASSEDCCCIQ